jgi:uncharacterized protein
VTKDNKKRNIATEIARGDAAFRAAELLSAQGLFADAVSRAYYAAFHYARALLLTIAEEPKTHAGVELLLQREFIRPGRFAPDIGRLLSRLKTYRLDADYTADYVFTEIGTQEEIDAARSFIEETRRVLADDGWLPPESR